MAVSAAQATTAGYPLPLLLLTQQHVDPAMAAN